MFGSIGFSNIGGKKVLRKRKGALQKQVCGECNYAISWSRTPKLLLSPKKSSRNRRCNMEHQPDYRDILRVLDQLNEIKTIDDLRKFHNRFRGVLQERLPKALELLNERKVKKYVFQPSGRIQWIYRKHSEKSMEPVQKGTNWCVLRDWH